jgi:hypothetical protein
MAKRMHMSPEQLTQTLNQGGINATPIKATILADMRWQIIIRARFQSRLQEIDKSGVNYTLRQILFLVPRDNAPLLEARRKDAEALRARFADCESGLAEARAQRDVVVRAPIVKNSSDFPPALRYSGQDRACAPDRAGDHLAGRRTGRRVRQEENQGRDAAPEKLFLFEARVGGLSQRVEPRGEDRIHAMPHPLALTLVEPAGIDAPGLCAAAL